MSAYLIVVAEISDRQAFIDGYAKRAAELLAQYGGKYLIRGPGATLLEGEFGPNASIVISEWPSRVAALNFWNSPEYSEIKSLREGIADVQVHLIEAPAIST